MTDRLQKSYDEHPLSASAILSRIGRKKRSLGITEWDCAIDRETKVTDQNHIGGAEQTIDLGNALQITRKDHVLDLACGLGGTCRLLAEVFKCKTAGIDRHAKRVQDGRRLNALVRLDKLVTLRTGDVFDGPKTTERRFSIVIGQASWGHFAKRLEDLRVWRAALVPGARIAIEDCFAGQRFRTVSGSGAVQRLAGLWNVSFRSVREWKEALARAGFEYVRQQDLTSELISYYTKRHELVGRSTIRVPRSEQLAYSIARRLASERIIAYYRLICIAP